VGLRSRLSGLGALWNCDPIVCVYGCISMQRYWSSLRFSFLRTLFLLAADYVVIQLLQHSASPRPRSHGLRRSQPTLRVSISRSTGILEIPLPVLLSNIYKSGEEGALTYGGWCVCAGGSVPLGADPALSWCGGGVSRSHT